MTQNIERSILSTIIMSDMLQDEERKKIETIELYEEWFTVHNYKIIVKIINSLKQINKPHTIEMVEYIAAKNGLNLEQEIINICSHNGFGTYGTMMNYVSEIKNNKKQTLQDLI